MSSVSEQLYSLINSSDVLHIRFTASELRPRDYDSYSFNMKRIYITRLMKLTL